MTASQLRYLTMNFDLIALSEC